METFRVNVIGYQQPHIMQSTGVAQILISSLADIQILIWVIFELDHGERDGLGRPTGDSRALTSMAGAHPVQPRW